MMADWLQYSILVSCMDTNFLSSLSISKIYPLEEGAKTKSPKIWVPALTVNRIWKDLKGHIYLRVALH